MSPSSSSAIRDHFELRASHYTKRTVWLSDSRIVREILRPLRQMRSSSVCVDLGGGTGELAKAGERTRVGQWIVLDISSGMLRAGGHPRSVVAHAEEIPLSTGTVDYIAARSVFSYVDTARTLNECGRILTSDGILVVAEKVVGEFFGEAATWLTALERIRNPVRRPSVEAYELAAAVTAGGFDVQSCVEVRRTYRLSMAEWLKVVPTDDQSRSHLLSLATNPPEGAISVGYSADPDGDVVLPTSWAVVVARPTRRKSTPSLVVTLVPVRPTNHGVEVYLQQRRAQLYSEPDLFGTWELPQGHVEGSESILDAAARELSEETGLRLVRPLFSTEISEAANGDQFSREMAYPDFVVRMSGRFNYLSLAFFVLTEDHGEHGSSIDNKGRWIPIRQLRANLVSRRIYPLNEQMVSAIERQADRVDELLSGGASQS